MKGDSMIAVACQSVEDFTEIENCFNINYVESKTLTLIRISTVDQMLDDSEISRRGKETRSQEFKQVLHEMFSFKRFKGLVIIRTRESDFDLKMIFDEFRSVYGAEFPIMIFSRNQPFVRLFPAEDHTYWVKGKRINDLLKFVCETFKNGSFITESIVRSKIHRRAEDAAGVEPAMLVYA